MHLLCHTLCLIFIRQHQLLAMRNVTHCRATEFLLTKKVFSVVLKYHNIITSVYLTKCVICDWRFYSIQMCVYMCVCFPKTEDYLKRKIRSRPERSELVRMHILEGWYLILNRTTLFNFCSVILPVNNKMLKLGEMHQMSLKRNHPVDKTKQF